MLEERAPEGKKRTHLATIRALVTRMSVGSLLLKVWSVLIVAALLAVTVNPAHARFAWLALFMAITFWMLDAYFLRQARLFRKIYDRIQNLTESEIDFLLDTSPVDSEGDAWRSILFSKTPTVFYGAVIGVIALVGLLLH